MQTLPSPPRNVFLYLQGMIHCYAFTLAMACGIFFKIYCNVLFNVIEMESTFKNDVKNSTVSPEDREVALRFYRFNDTCATCILVVSAFTFLNMCSYCLTFRSANLPVNRPTILKYRDGEQRTIPMAAIEIMPVLALKLRGSKKEKRKTTSVTEKVAYPQVSKITRIYKQRVRPGRHSKLATMPMITMAVPKTPKNAEGARRDNDNAPPSDHGPKTQFKDSQKTLQIRVKPTETRVAPRKDNEAKKAHTSRDIMTKPTFNEANNSSNELSSKQIRDPKLPCTSHRRGHTDRNSTLFTIIVVTSCCTTSTGTTTESSSSSSGESSKGRNSPKRVYNYDVQAIELAKPANIMRVMYQKDGHDKEESSSESSSSSVLEDDREASSTAASPQILPAPSSPESSCVSLAYFGLGGGESDYSDTPFRRKHLKQAFKMGSML